MKNLIVVLLATLPFLNLSGFLNQTGFIKTNIMKNLILLFISSLLLNSCCKNTNLYEELPPATQTAAGIFACHVNGQSFIDRSGDVAYYQNVNGDYYFGAGGSDRKIQPWAIKINSQKRQIAEGQTFLLTEYSDNNVFGSGGFKINTTPGILFANTDLQYTGELKITKLDYTNSIVSGTFWFDLKNPITGATVQIRDGRFDLHFTQ